MEQKNDMSQMLSLHLFMNEFNRRTASFIASSANVFVIYGNVNLGNKLQGNLTGSDGSVSAQVAQIIPLCAFFGAG